MPPARVPRVGSCPRLAVGKIRLCSRSVTDSLIQTVLPPVLSVNASGVRGAN